MEIIDYPSPLRSQMRSKIRKSLNERVFHKVILGVIMFMIGILTLFASINTYEVIALKDVPISSVIRPITVSKNKEYNSELVKYRNGAYDMGSFGVPKKIKFPESNKHIDITPSIYSNNSWNARKGVAHMFITSQSRQKMFGSAVVYMRINTATTQTLGDVLRSDVVNIVTSEGWQLGYKVTDTAEDPSQLSAIDEISQSAITVILVDEQSDRISSFNAVLLKVGDRI